ncbi:hypothetical protein [Lujinxingia litoralis]|uniref:hypothetical protein n=1 Tax=Lujinxingia litoralis TaxID=2211119 RepID=UPI0013140C53
MLADDGSRRSILSSEARQAEVNVYNFEVEHAHTYFVYPRGDDSAVLVPNKAARRRTPSQDITSAWDDIQQGASRNNVRNPK